MSAGLQAVRSALAGGRAWLVGGAVRDRALGRPGEIADIDVVVDGDPAAAARAVAQAAGGAACFALSEDFGAWRVVARDHSWQVDVEPMRGGSIAADLALRDFTVNAIAEPLHGGEPIDPLGGLADLRARRLRMAGAAAFSDDPLRVLRLVRVALELDLEIDDHTLREARASSAGLGGVAPERVFTELRRIIATPDAVRGLRMVSELGATAIVLPELDALHGVEQSRFHHRDVHGHTLEVLDRVIQLTMPGGLEEPELGPAIGSQAAAAAALLEEPLADGITRGEALRWGALLHDAAKPLTREVRAADGRVTFIGHDARGAELARAVLERLRASERLRSHAAALVRHHLRLGFLVHEQQPLARRIVFSYLQACSPVEVDVTLLSIADRLATRGDRARESIDAHLRLAGGMLVDALRWRQEGPPAPLLRGDELASELGITTGPRVGEILRELAAAQYAGELATREQAIAHARSLG
ncbi:MAG: polynucleotide adenylyltransferase/metal dependent phosphohydrolase [Solirubrobacterales bacterium]|nr:polynucleotide adenylyltransferase/metal dependent phosphohydrolase [Solirubrobacterales bacterium]